MAWRLLLGALCLLMHGVISGGEDEGSKILDALLGAAPAPPPLAPAPPPLAKKQKNTSAALTGDGSGDSGDGDGGDSGDGDGGFDDFGPTQTTKWVDPNLPTTPPPIIAADAPACAVNLASFIFKVTRVARYLTLATTDCAQPGQVGAVCADDILQILQFMGEGATQMSSATFDCGNLNSACAQLITAAVGHISEATDKLVTLEITCFNDLDCIVTVFDFMSAAVHAAKDIDTAIDQCKAGADDRDAPAPPPPPPAPPPLEEEQGSAPAPPPLAELEKEQGSAPAPPPLAELEKAQGSAPAPTRLLLHGSLDGRGGLRRPVVGEASSPDVLAADAQGLE